MLALLKKTGSSAAKDAGAPWRADFRQPEYLPDTKTVRTTFLVNVVVLTILGSLILWVAYREIGLRNLKDEIVAVGSQIEASVAPNAAAEALYKSYLAEEKKLKDFQALSASDFSFPDYLIHFASLMPAGVRANRIDFRGVNQTILVSGTVDGHDTASNEVAGRFFKTLEEDDEFKKIFSQIRNSNLGRSEAANALSFELVFTFAKPTPAKK